MGTIKKLIFEDEAYIDKLKGVRDFRHLKILRFFLIHLNSWPDWEKASKSRVVNHFFQFIICVSCFTTGNLYIILHRENLTFYELGHMYLTLMMALVWTSRVCLASPVPASSKYKVVGGLFLNDLHLFYFKDVSEYAMKTYKRVYFISHIFTLYLTGQMFTGLFLFNVIPAWSNYSAGKFKDKILYNSTYEHSLYFSLPVLKMYTHFDAYIFGCIFNWCMSYLCSLSFCMMDLFLSLIIFNLWGHIKILLYDLTTFPLPANKTTVSINDKNAPVTAEMYSENELKIVNQKLKKCIQYHQLIADFTNKTSEAFGPMLFVYFTFHQVAGCLLLLECSPMTAEALMRYVPLSIILFQQLIQLSVIFELIGSASEKLKDAVYGVPWQYMDRKNRSIVLIFLLNVKDPIHVKALGLVDVGVTTMATILKTSLSYFTFLSSL